VQGYLAHKTAPRPWDLTIDLFLRPCKGPGWRAFSYKRGSPVTSVWWAAFANLVQDKTTETMSDHRNVQNENIPFFEKHHEHSISPCRQIMGSISPNRAELLSKSVN